MLSKKFFNLLFIASVMISGSAYCSGSIHNCPDQQAWVAADQMCEKSCPQGEAWANEACRNITENTPATKNPVPFIEAKQPQLKSV